MIIPDYLQKGDTIAIVSTARKISKTEINFAVIWLQELGYKVVLGKTIGLEYHQFAGTDVERATDFQEMLNNPKIKAIWCARGGYGTVRMIDLIDFYGVKKNPKWIIGYSDITVLHAHLHNLGIETIHAPMPIDIEKATKEAKHTLSNTLSGKFKEISFESVNNNKLGKVKAVAVGGNLSVLYSLCGSNSAISTKGKILFIEDLDEYLYHINRMLQNLDRNGIFKDLKALVIGGMTKMHDNTIPFGFSVEEQILELTKKYNYPIVFNAPFGHIKDNRPVVFGREYDLIVEQQTVVLKYAD